MSCHVDLGDLIHTVVIGARWAGLSLSETVDLLGIHHTATSRVYTAGWCEKN